MASFSFSSIINPIRRAFYYGLFLITVFLFFQCPAFVFLYEGHLIGHLKELKFQTQEIQKIAHFFQENYDSYTQVFLDSEEPRTNMQGQFLKNMKNRLENFQEHANALKGPSRYPAFVQHFDYALFIETWHHFTPSIMVSFESLLWMLAGVVVGWWFWLKRLKIYS